MKKLLIVLAFAGVTLGIQAQDAEVTKHSVVTNSFWQNWFVQGNFHWDAWYSQQEHGHNLDRGLFKSHRSHPGASIAIGKWFTPGLGLRTKVQGIWGRDVDGTGGYNVARDGYPNHNLSKNTKYWIANEHVLFNLSNMLCGYNPNRFWSFIPFAGGGVGRNMSENYYAMGLSLGILNEFRLSDKLAVNVEAGWNRYENDIDGNGSNFHGGTRIWRGNDENVYGEIGLTLNLGKSTWDRVPDVDAIKALSQAQIDALNARLNEANAENARLQNLLKNQPKPGPAPGPSKTVKEFITTPVSVFFNINKTNIASKYDLVNVRALAKYAVENNSNIKVDGYADSATGTPDHNQWLSEERAKTVAGELVNMGVNANKIKTQGHGGVDELSPISFNRRATVRIVE
ncbi:MAG: OmpA family protein [Prevotella sp.]|nr:OmpA family protein [Prevotella sp.]